MASSVSDTVCCIFTCRDTFRDTGATKAPHCYTLIVTYCHTKSLSYKMHSFARLKTLSDFQKGFAYVVRDHLYLSLTNRCNSATLVETRGPGFTMPVTTVLAHSFEPLVWMWGVANPA